MAGTLRNGVMKWGKSEALEEATQLPTHQEFKAAILGSVGGENAKRKRSSKMKTGTKRRSNGGGGKGGNTKGNTRMDKVRRTKLMIIDVLSLFYVVMCNGRKTGYRR
ncbi:unnamed protein product [Lupinus luteus]|uniref:Uncharacterized protein n=1 Tax=Lupinus luteus TaxID=3873 RepID=A0AAV1WL74_LUPLU